jgi:hypothetical protein
MLGWSFAFYVLRWFALRFERPKKRGRACVAQMGVEERVEQGEVDEELATSAILRAEQGSATLQLEDVLASLRRSRCRLPSPSTTTDEQAKLVRILFRCGLLLDEFLDDLLFLSQACMLQHVQWGLVPCVMKRENESGLEFPYTYC